MFEDVKADFEERVREVHLYFQVLAALDNDEIAIKEGAGPQIVPIGSPPADWGRMVKGSAYLILYNLVEAFVSRGFFAVFETIRNDRLCAVELSDRLRDEWVKQKNRKVTAANGSPKVYMDIASEIVRDIAENKVVHLTKENLPFSGNLDAEKIRQICYLHGVDCETPREAKGGSALDSVKQKRNALAHGDESFAECGRFLVADDLIAAKDEVIIFVRAILSNLEIFANEKKYRAVAP